MWQIWRFTMFLSISLPLSRNLTPSLSYHVVSYVNESRRWQTFSLFALSELVYSLFSLSELVCTNKEFYPIILLPLLSHPKLLPLWSVTDRQTEGRTTFFTPYGSFFHWARGALPAGATLLGWPNYGVDGRLNKCVASCLRIFFSIWVQWMVHLSRGKPPNYFTIACFEHY
jgi:hypothetical protein